MMLFAHGPTDKLLPESTRKDHLTDLGRNRCRDPAANARRHRGRARATCDLPTRWDIDHLLLRPPFGPRGGRSSNPALRHRWPNRQLVRENVLLARTRIRLFR